MKKILILMLMLFGLVACGEKFPYTSKSNKEKMLKEFKVAVEKAEKSRDEKDTQVAIEKMSEIIKIATELEKRSSNGDEKAKEELDKWNEIIEEMKIQF
ncbi:hypothetical protein I6H56_03800 [Fusobacterium canifelinum]|uniref:Lipoprotein n=1 Tax=Fusobacterium canifelinum TaxID=285729 RepID=A0A7T4KH21_9FUSO|nr:hypothetical protein [Fusobacterium canifelinum]QQB74591.1 hypothetical protein I6H56_03800 [Fusobacterium canifelinum]